MDFQLKRIILWPNNTELETREIEFQSSKINIITGDQAKGKSALLWIADYCLASSSCRIPVGIRQYVSWFGIVLTSNGQEILFARRSPNEPQAASEMHFLRSQNIITPVEIEKNASVDDVKAILNNLANLDDFSNRISTEEDVYPSFRDTVSFNFQPQYLIANQSTLFFKADSFIHRKKLKNIFPFILGAVDAEGLIANEEMKKIDQRIKAIEREQELFKKSLEKWLGEIRGTYEKAKEFGLLAKRPDPSEAWEATEYLRILKEIPPAVMKVGLPMIEEGATNTVTNRIKFLRMREIELATKIQNSRIRIIALKRISEANANNLEDSMSQRQRTKSVGWFLKRLENESKCPFCESTTGTIQKNLKILSEKTKTINTQIDQASDTKSLFSFEISKVENELMEFEQEVNQIRSELRQLASDDQRVQQSFQTAATIYKFIGELETRLREYDLFLDDGGIENDLAKLRARRAQLEKLSKNEHRQAILSDSLGSISGSIVEYAKFLNAERSEDEISLQIDDLTLNFKSKTGQLDALWEIGSGANYMSYHLATLLALQKFFVDGKNSHVPNFIFFDQPSQVYFPDDESSDDEALKENDRMKVRKIFELLSLVLKQCKGKLQIIVLEHAGRPTWENIDGVHLVKRWRKGEEDSALIPASWIPEK